MSGCPWSTNAGTRANPTAGTVTTAPMAAPSPTVAPSRNLLRGKVAASAGVVSGMAGAPLCAGSAGAGSGGPCASVSACGRLAWPRLTSLIQRKPKMTVSAAPTATAGQLTIRPTRMQTMPTAKPTGQRLGGGPCDDSPPAFTPTGFNQALTSQDNDVTRLTTRTRASDGRPA